MLEAAVAASADDIVTFNTSDFDRASSLGVRVITPPQLFALITRGGCSSTGRVAL